VRGEVRGKSKRWKEKKRKKGGRARAKRVQCSKQMDRHASSITTDQYCIEAYCTALSVPELELELKAFV
jgi:hypothetical protein